MVFKICSLDSTYFSNRELIRDISDRISLMSSEHEHSISLGTFRLRNVIDDSKLEPLIFDKSGCEPPVGDL